VTKFYSINMKDAIVTCFTNEEQVMEQQRLDSNNVPATSAEQVGARIGGPSLAGLYSMLTTEKVKKFSDRKTGGKRVWDAIEALNLEPGESFTPMVKLAEVEVELGKTHYLPSPPRAGMKDIVVDGKVAGAEVVAKHKVLDEAPAKKKVAKKKGVTKKNDSMISKVSKYAGKKLIKKVKENPRREGTHGWHSWSKFKSGDTYETAIKNGSRRVDLDWDIKHGHLEVK